MRRTGGSRDEDLEPARLGGARVLEEKVRGAVRGDHPHLVRHPEPLERLGGVAHGLPVGGGAHDDADGRGTQASTPTPPSPGIPPPVTTFESSAASQTAVPVRSSGSSARWIAICMSMMYCR